MIPYSTQHIEDDDIKCVCEALKSSHLTQGDIGREFESAIAKHTNSTFAIAFNSATSALYALYGAFMQIYQENSKQDSKQDLYFITTPISFVATTNMMLSFGIKPIFCDIYKDGNINTQSLEHILQTHKFKESIKAIVSVDYAGKSVEALEIQKIAKKYGIFFFSDSSHSFGGELDSKPVGSFADASVFSFHAVKPITTAEGGAIVTNNPKIAHFARLICSHGVIKGNLWNYDCQLVGMNFRLSDVASALGLSQIQKITRFIDKREQIARIYDTAFAKNDFCYINTMPKNIKSTRHLYPIFLYPNLWCAKQDIFKALQDLGLGVQVHYKPIYQFSLYKKLFGEFALKSADEFYLAELSIPCNQSMSVESAYKIADIVLDTLKKFSKSYC